MSFRQVLFGKVDLDTIMTGIVMGVLPGDNLCCARGSASSGELSDKRTLCLEVGGTGRQSENNFDHHPQKGEQKLNLSACAQALERMACLVRYVDCIDRGERIDVEVDQKSFPSLVSLVSGMKLCVFDPEDQMREGMKIMRTVIQSGLDPYGCMDEIADWIPEARRWIETKKEHERKFKEAIKNAMWLTTLHGIKIAAVKTTWIGAPGALYGAGAHAVVCLNPDHIDRGKDKSYRKFTVAVHRSTGIELSRSVELLSEVEAGWGGPAHMTICGSPMGVSSQLSLKEVMGLVLKGLQSARLKKEPNFIADIPELKLAVG